MSIEINPIGFVSANLKKIPRHWTVSDAEGILIIDEKYLEGLKDIKPGQRVVVIFQFHKSPPFTSEFLIQKPPHHNGKRGIFSICSPIRPNPIGMSVLEVLFIRANKVYVKGLDMLNGTPILDIKPYIEAEKNTN
ncbi:MAG: tRNA (N6-threonylcarbamoyladenosine(37)-N6)-methyltransferase TrmO [Desulfobacterales bacterium]|nr:tRNA (N6-threonylcarbamoyladenosine(37)-N6)-methyltransferase TrmO [Desulfobacterales bacterium]